VKLLFRDTSQDLMEKGGRMVTALAAGTPVEVLSRPVNTTVGPAWWSRCGTCAAGWRWSGACCTWRGTTR
jgi:hypothetical protein